MDGTCLSLIKRFENVEDHRVNRTKLHKPIDNIVMLICAVVAGADSFNAIEVFATAHEQWFSRFLELPDDHKILSFLSLDLLLQYRQHIEHKLVNLLVCA